MHTYFYITPIALYMKSHILEQNSRGKYPAGASCALETLYILAIYRLYVYFLIISLASFSSCLYFPFWFNFLLFFFLWELACFIFYARCRKRWL